MEPIVFEGQSKKNKIFSLNLHTRTCYFVIDFHLTVEGMKVDRVYESPSACVHYGWYHVLFFNYFFPKNSGGLCDLCCFEKARPFRLFIIII